MNERTLVSGLASIWPNPFSGPFQADLARIQQPLMYNGNIEHVKKRFEIPIIFINQLFNIIVLLKQVDCRVWVGC
jgi:hypothetical protein